MPLMYIYIVYVNGLVPRGARVASTFRVLMLSILNAVHVLSKTFRCTHGKFKRCATMQNCDFLCSPINMPTGVVSVHGKEWHEPLREDDILDLLPKGIGINVPLTAYMRVASRPHASSMDYVFLALAVGVGSDIN